MVCIVAQFMKLPLHWPEHAVPDVPVARAAGWK